MATLNEFIAVLKLAEPLTTMFALVAAVLSGLSAWMSYRLTKNIRDELRSDETLVAGVLDHPDLVNADHKNAALQTTVFNKSKRKCVIHKVQVFDRKGVEIDVNWAQAIDAFGNPQGRGQLIGVVDEATLCMRRCDGLAFDVASVHVSHSFDDKPLVLTYEMGPGWQRYFAKTT